MNHSEEPIGKLWNAMRDLRDDHGRPEFSEIERWSIEEQGERLPESTIRGWFEHETVPPWKKFKVLLAFFREQDKQKWRDMWLAAADERERRRSTPVPMAPMPASPQDPPSPEPIEAMTAGHDAGGEGENARHPAAASAPRTPSDSVKDPPTPEPTRQTTFHDDLTADGKRTSRPESMEQAHEGPSRLGLDAIRPAVVRRPLLLAVAVGLIALVVLGVGFAALRSGANVGGRTVSGGSPADCDRYEVAPRDLWLRDRYGGTLTELTHGQQVTVENRNNPSGLHYWYVRADDRAGWVDPRHLRPLC